MKNSLETRLGIFFAVGVLAAMVLLDMAGGLDLFRKGYRLKSLFTSVQELKKDDPVKLAGVEIGRVEKLEFTDGKVMVFMKIDDSSAPIHTDSKTCVKFAGLMGANFVSIDFGTPNGRPVTDGTLLESKEQPDISAVLAKLEGVADGIERLTASWSNDNFSNLLAPFTDFMKENSPRLTAILGNIQNISKQIADGEGTVGKLVKDDGLYRSAQQAVDKLSQTATEIDAVLAEAKSVVTDINAGKGTIGKLAREEALYNEATAAMTNLREILQKINQGQGSVGKLVNDDSLYKNVKLSLQKLDKVAEGFEDQGPLTVLGIAINPLF